MATIGQLQSEYQKLHIRYMLFPTAINVSWFVKLQFWYEDNGRIIYASLTVLNSAPLLCCVASVKLAHENVESFLPSLVFCKSASLTGFEIDIHDQPVHKCLK